LSRKTIELAKTILILLLTISGMFLAWQAGIFNGVVTAFPVIGNTLELMRGPATISQAPPRGGAIQEAARPVSIVITNADGERFGVRHDTELRNVVYDMSSSIFGEALGFAGEHMQVTEDEWRQALSEHSVFFEYITPVSLSVLDGWFGARMPDDAAYDIEIRRILVSFSGERSRIYFQDNYSGLYFAADTASAAGKAQDLEIFVPNGVEFAFETGLRGSENAPYFLILQGDYHSDIQSAAAGNQHELLELALNVFGHIHEALPTPFIADGDVLMSLGSNFNLRIEPDGRAVYRWTDEVARENISAPSIAEMIETARVLAVDSIGQKQGEAEVMFESIEYDEGLYTVIFGYYFAGGRIYLYDDRPAARVTFDYGTIIEAELNFRSFVSTGTRTRLVPQRQALAAAGGEFILSYFDTGSEILYPSWVKVWF